MFLGDTDLKTLVENRSARIGIEGEKTANGIGRETMGEVERIIEEGVTMEVELDSAWDWFIVGGFLMWRWRWRERNWDWGQTALGSVWILLFGLG